MVAIQLFDLISNVGFRQYLPDFVLGFAFFTAMAYAVLGERFDHERSSVIMSIVVGLALAAAMVTWEIRNNFTVAALGPFAITLALLLLAGMVYEIIRRIGGHWSGGVTALAVVLLLGSVLGVNWPGADGYFIVAGVVVLIVSIVMLIHSHTHDPGAISTTDISELTTFRSALDELRTQQTLSQQLQRRLHAMDRPVENLDEHPDVARQMQAYLDRILPSEQWLTQRLSALQTKVAQLQAGHIDRIHDLRALAHRLPADARHRVVTELQGRLRELRLDHRLRRLADAVTEAEQRVVNLTGRARTDLQVGNLDAVPDLLHEAEKLQRHVEHLLHTIERTEQRLIHEAEDVAQAFAPQ